MIIFIDESGIHGKVGHSITAVVYVKVEDLEEFENKLKEIERELRITSFHWTDERWFMRNKFFSKVWDLNFRVSIAIFDNPIKPEKMLELVFKHLITDEKIKNIYIDGEKPKWYENRLKKVLRDKGVGVKKLKTVRSKSEVGIQLADALAGLARYCYDNPEAQDAKKLFSKLKRSGKLSIQMHFDSNACEPFLPKH